MFNNGADMLAKIKLNKLKNKNARTAYVSHMTMQSRSCRQERTADNPRIIELDQEEGEEYPVIYLSEDKVDNPNMISLEIPDLLEEPKEQMEEDQYILRDSSEPIQLPLWNKFIAPAGASKRRIPPSVRLEGPLIRDLANIMIMIAKQ